MQIKLRGNKVAVEKIKKADKKGTSFLVVPESEQYTGVIRYVGELASTDLKVGQKVYFSTTYQTTRMAGTELCVMEDKEVYATIED